MSSITNVNNNSSIVTVGRTTPVSPGQQPAAKSIPVVLATDQTPVPVEEQNKVQSEVALSLLGIPRAEVALGIFADVNTYDVNPSEWSSAPEFYLTGHGIRHLPNEAGALVDAPRNKTAVLTSKRFFRYQPGRVSAATFGIKSSVSKAGFAQNPIIRKYGIFDNFDGYYWETRENGEGDNFAVIRRTQSVGRNPSTPYGNPGQPLRGNNTGGALVEVQQFDDYRICGKGDKSEEPILEFVRDRELLINQRFTIVEEALKKTRAAYGTGGSYDGTTLVEGTDTNGETWYEAQARIFSTYTGSTIDAAGIEAKCKRDVDYWIDFFLEDMAWGGTAHTSINLTNFITGLNLLGDANSGANGVTFESLFYPNLKAEFAEAAYALSSGAGSAVEKLQALTDIVIAGFGNTTVDATSNGINSTTIVQNFTFGDRSTLNFGTKGALDTIYDVKKHYWGYFVAAFQDSGGSDPNPYNNSTPSIYYYSVSGDGADGTIVTNDTDVVYRKEINGYTIAYTLADIKYKCQRDIGYVIDGYKNDIVGGGNAETKYNMSMYYQGSGLSIGSQDITEKARHTYLRELILYDIDTKFGYDNTTSVYSDQADLSQRVINNFDIENTDSMVTGERGFAGNLITLRDGLVLVHAAVYDPALLKEKKQIVSQFDLTAETVRITEGVVTYGQHVRLARTENDVDIGPLERGGIYRVRQVVGPKGNEFTLEDENRTPLDFSAVTQTDVDNAGKVYFETVVPFIFPKNYDPAEYFKLASEAEGNYGVYPTDPTGSEDVFPVGMMFPYMYAADQNLLNTDTSVSYRVGFINTALDTSSDTNLNLVREQIDNVNFIPEYINWIKNNVNPQYWGVYEYRVPRSRFSFDTLDGRTETTSPQAYRRVYSDVATGETGIVRPGQPFQIDGISQFADSVYDYDFTKVTMLKIEFSWYGAVGALFLAYVPVSNGEARWVRVHHLRASNQLKIASLGNATLPITYNVYGGGDSLALGDGEEEGGTAEVTGLDQGYGTDSHNVVKYGASYYIDGGDRGTVRLYSHNNDDVIPAYGKQWAIAPAAYNAGDNSITINAANLAGNVRTDVDPTFFMKAKLKTGDRIDQNIRVTYADPATGKLFLSSVPNDTSSLTLITDRANFVYGLETKRVILSTEEGNAVRNRVQVYPTKLSSSNLNANPCRLRMKKTPLFQFLTVPNGTFELNGNYVITSANLPLDTAEGGITESTYLVNNESLYGWFRGLVDEIDEVTVFGRLYKDADQYYFEMLETYSGVVTLIAGKFLAEKRFAADGEDLGAATTKTQFEKEGLSSILITNDVVTPIPDTGTNVATLYLQQGAEQFDLSPYFDYNKEYLSFPLTDQPESLFLTVDSDQGSATTNDISIGITFEEQ